MGAFNHILLCMGSYHYVPAPPENNETSFVKRSRNTERGHEKVLRIIIFQAVLKSWGGGVALDAFKHVFLYFVQTFVCADAYCYSVVVSVNEASNDSVPSSPLSPDNLSFRAHSMKRKYSRRKRPDDTVAWWQIQ